MQAFLRRGLLALLAATLPSGCVVVEKHRRSIASPSCRPSQYWDGHQCRHKGKGHGARKHDGPGKPGGKHKGRD